MASLCNVASVGKDLRAKSGTLMLERKQGIRGNKFTRAMQSMPMPESCRFPPYCSVFNQSIARTMVYPYPKSPRTHSCVEIFIFAPNGSRNFPLQRNVRMLYMSPWATVLSTPSPECGHDPNRGSSTRQLHLSVHALARDFSDLLA